MDEVSRFTGPLQDLMPIGGKIGQITEEQVSSVRFSSVKSLFGRTWFIGSLRVVMGALPSLSAARRGDYPHMYTIGQKTTAVGHLADSTAVYFLEQVGLSRFGPGCVTFTVKPSLCLSDGLPAFRQPLQALFRCSVSCRLRELNAIVSPILKLLRFRHTRLHRD